MSIANIRARLSRGESLENLKLPVLNRSVTNNLQNELVTNDFKNDSNELESEATSELENELIDEPTLILHGVGNIADVTATLRVANKVSDLKKKDEELDLDYNFKDNKLDGYELVDYKTLKVGDHFRITSNIYKQDGRKCSYMIVKKVLDDGKLKCNSYKELYSDWVIDPDNRWKNYKFYYKKPVLPCGKCMRCEKRVPDPYLICIDCRLSNN